jgi:hypothetical protein
MFRVEQWRVIGFHGLLPIRPRDDLPIDLYQDPSLQEQSQGSSDIMSRGCEGCPLSCGQGMVLATWKFGKEKIGGSLRHWLTWCTFNRDGDTLDIVNILETLDTLNYYF